MYIVCVYSVCVYCLYYISLIPYNSLISLNVFLVKGSHKMWGLKYKSKDSSKKYFICVDNIVKKKFVDFFSVAFNLYCKVDDRG